MRNRAHPGLFRTACSCAYPFTDDGPPAASIAEPQVLKGKRKESFGGGAKRSHRLSWR
jgi:hypothetical protein